MESVNTIKSNIESQDKKSTALLLVSDFLFKIVNPLIFILLFRYTNLVKVGYFSFVNFLSAVTVIVVNFGMDYYITNDLAKNIKAADTEISKVLSVKIPLSFIYVILSMFYVIFFSGEAPIYFILLVVIGIQLSNQVSLTLTHILILKRFSLLSQITRFIFMWAYLLANIFTILVWKNFNIWLLVNSACIFLYLFVLFFIILCYCKIPIKISIKHLLEIKILKICFPYFLIALLAFLYMFIGVIILFQLKGPEIVAYYRTVFSLYLMTNMIPASFLMIFTPRLSELQKNATREFTALFVKIFNYIIILDFVAIFFFIYNADIIKLVFGHRLAAFPSPGAAKAIRLFVFTLLPFSFSNVLGTMLIIMGFRKKLIILNLGALICEACFVYILVPAFSVWACIFSHLAVECFLAAAIPVTFLRNLSIKINWWTTSKFVLFFLILIIIYLASPKLSLILHFIIYVAVFISFGLFLKIFTANELKAAVNTIKYFNKNFDL